MPKRHFEDFAVGNVLPLPERRVARGEIIAFAAEFDPQPFHLDEQAPATDLTGGLIASGWHACAVFMRLLCDGWLLDSASLGSPGIDTLKWTRPLRPEDRVSGRSTVLDRRASRSRPNVGLVRFRHELVNQSGDVIMWMENSIFFARRDAS